MLLRSRLDGGSRNEDERATTSRPRTPVSAEAISSVIPLAKKSCVASLELFSSGSTATVAGGAWGAGVLGAEAPGACAAADESAMRSTSPVTPATPKHQQVKPVRNLFIY